MARLKQAIDKSDGYASLAVARPVLIAWREHYFITFGRRRWDGLIMGFISG
jgi:hypothetical protein